MSDPFNNFDCRDIANEFRDVADQEESFDLPCHSQRVAELVPQPPSDDGMMHTMEAFHWVDKSGDIVPSRWLKPAIIRPLGCWQNTFDTPHVDETKRWTRLFFPGYSSSTLRRKESVTFLEFLVFDIDGGQLLVEAEQFICDASLDAVIYTSWNHNASKHGVVAERFRIAIRLAERFVMAENGFQIEEAYNSCSQQSTASGQQVWSRVYELVGSGLNLNFDKACTDASRLFCMPAHPLEREQDFRLIKIAGEALDLHDITEHAKQKLRADVQAHMQRAAEREARRGESVTPSLREIEAALQCIPPCAEYPTWREVIWAVHDEFVGTENEADAFDLIESWSAGCPDKFDPDVLADLWADARAGKGVTLGTLFHHAFNHGFDRDEYVRDRLTKLFNEE